MNAKTYELFIKRYDAVDPRLGRHVVHDSRSLDYQVEAEPLSSLISVRHNRFIPILDQGRVGSCAPNAGVGNVGTGLFWNSLAVQHALSDTDANADEQFALQIYQEATAIDPWPGGWPNQDTGTNGLSVAKALQTRGLISGYLWATSLEAVLTALSKQAVIIGVPWKESMFTPASDGKLTVSGSDAGGHEIELDELDMDNFRVWLANSWSLQWGIQGRAYLSFDDLGLLLSQDGDCTVFVENGEPAPTPTPVEPVVEDPRLIFERRVHRATRLFLENFPSA